jgi:hypothetical protein
MIAGLVRVCDSFSVWRAGETLTDSIPPTEALLHVKEGKNKRKSNPPVRALNTASPSYHLMTAYDNAKELRAD